MSCASLFLVLETVLSYLFVWAPNPPKLQNVTSLEDLCDSNISFTHFSRLVCIYSDEHLWITLCVYNVSTLSILMDNTIVHIFIWIASRFVNFLICWTDFVFFKSAQVSYISFLCCMWDSPYTSSIFYRHVAFLFDLV